MSARLKGNRCFSDDVLALLQKSKGLRLRAGVGAHRFIGIWFVVVKDRVLVRSWSVKPDGWYRAFLNDPSGCGPSRRLRSCGPRRAYKERASESRSRSGLPG
jgi:hypothetical protein